MSYNKRIWANGDLITKEGMNNIEYGIYDAHDKINAINNKVEENTTDTNTARQDISDIKLQIGTEELTTTSKKIKGAINDLSSQIKDIEKQNYNIITPVMFGAKGDGVADDTTAVQNALDYFNNKACKLIIERPYKVMPKTMSDGTNVCVYLNSTTSAPAYEIRGEIEFRNGGKLFTTSNEECTLFRFNASNVRVENLNLCGVIGKTTLLELSRLNKNTNEDNSILYNNFKKGKLVQCKYGITMEGSCYYNSFNDFYFINCDRMIWLKPTEYSLSTGNRESNVNRNYFTNITGNVGNKQGIYLEYGDTNKFINISFEGLSDWAVFIKDYTKNYSDWFYTESNEFLNITFEACSKQIYNESNSSQFYSVNYSKNVCNFIEVPMFISNGYIEGYSPSRLFDYEVNSENTLTNGALPWGSIIRSANGLGSKDFYDIDVANGEIIRNNNRKTQGFSIAECENVTNIKYNGNYDGLLTKCMGGIVFMQSKLIITVTNTTQDIKLNYPDGLKCEVGKLSGWGNIIPFVQTVICDGSITFVELTENYIVIKKPSTDWGNTVTVHMSLIYFRET